MTNHSSLVRQMVLALCVGQVASSVPIIGAPAAKQSQPTATATPKDETVRVNRTAPHGSPPPALMFTTSPTNEEITRARIFSEPLVPMNRPTSRDENAALARAILAYRDTKQSEMVAPLLVFLTRYPQSAWRASLMANIGTVYRASGYLSKALSAWDGAWAEAHTATDLRGRNVADYALGEWLETSANIGRADEIESRLAEVSGRDVSGRATQKIGAAREALWVFKYHHEFTVPSGSTALQAILATAAQKNHTPFVQDASLRKYHAMPAGTSLTEMKSLAKTAGLNYEMAFKSRDGAFPIPSVIHWRVDHYSALVQENNGKFLLVDPALGGGQWVTRDMLDQESSGFFLAAKEDVASSGARVVLDSEGTSVVGHCLAGAPYDGDPGPPPGPDPPSTDPGPPTDPDPPDPSPPTDGTPPCAMPVYSFEMMPASLRITDTPVNCHSPRGPGTGFRMTYNQRDNQAAQTFYYGNIGPKWTFDWLSWVLDNPNSADIQADVYLRGGGVEHYADGAAHSIYAPQWHSRAVLAKVSADPVRYERRLPDGGLEVFTQSDGTITAGRRVFLTDVIDPQGQSLHMTYDANVRLIAVTDAIGLVTSLSYELASDPTKITKVTDPYGRVATFTYNASGQLASSTDVIGMTSSFLYSAGDFVIGMTTPYGTTLFAHESDQLQTNSTRFVQATDPLGGTERVEFHWITSIPATAATSEVPDGFSGYNNTLDHYNSFYWDKRAMALYPGDISKAVTMHWLLWSYTSYISLFFEHGFSVSVPHSVKRPLENRLWYAYPGQDSTGLSVGTWVQPSKVARVMDDGVSQVWQATYNEQGQVTQKIDPLGRQQALTYAANGIDLLEVHQTTGGLNDLLVSFSDYTAQHRPQMVTDAAGQATTVTYNSAGQVLTVTNAKGETTTYSYDANGYLQSATGPISGATTTFSYDAYGRRRTTTESDGYATTFDYDALDRPTRVTYPDGTYDSATYARLDAEQRRDRLGRISRMFYDPLGRLVAIRDPLGRTVTQQWCTCGTLDRLIDANGHSTVWLYDLEGRTIREVRDDGSTATVYSYENTTSRLKTITDPKGQTTNKGYAADNALTQLTYTSAEQATPSVTFTYDTNYARLTTMADGTGTTSYTYKAVGTLGGTHVASIDGPLSDDTLVYEYDELGRSVGRAINNAGVTSTFDALGRLTQEVNPLGTFDYAYVGTSGRVASVAYPNGQATIYDYIGNAGDRRLLTIQHQRSDSSNLAKLDYTYDVLGNIQTWAQLADTAAPTVQLFRYDAADQLTTATKQTTDTTPSVLGRFAYAYDPAGNRTSEQVDDDVTTATHDRLNRLTGQSGGGSIRISGTLDEPARVTIQGRSAIVDASNAFTGTASVVSGTTTVAIAAVDGSGNQSLNTYEIAQSGAGASFGYDANGNVVSDGTRSLTWDAEDRLISVTIGTHVSTFTYDGLSRRVEIVEADNGSITSDMKFVWCGLTICEARDSSGSIVTKRYFGQGVQDNGTAYFYTRDHLGSVRELTDATGVVRARYDYDPWGRRTKVSGDKDADMGFTGHYQHVASGLTLTLFRAYDASLGRWVSEDPLELGSGDANRYRYALGNPIQVLDPLGLCVKNPRNYVVSQSVLDQLNRFNDYIGQDKDVVITGGNRPPDSRLGAGGNSTHVRGTAADIKVPGQSNLDTAKQAAASTLFGGVGWYQEGYHGPGGEGPHVHVDLRQGTALWGFEADGTQHHGSLNR